MKISNFSKQYRNINVEMKDIDSEERIIVLKGENGSGKSTVLKAMNRLISYQGDIISEGSISYMNESIRFPRNYMDQAPSDRVIRLIDQFELTDKINEKIHTLSKGMKMKLQLICTFLIERDIYLLDEPFSGLDDDSVKLLVDYIQKSNKRFVITSHIEVNFDKDCDVILV